MAKNGRGGRRNQRLNRPLPKPTPRVESLSAPEEFAGRNLPENLIVEILCRTPVKSLVKFRCVCRSWIALILHPKFIAMHLEFNTLRNKQILFHSYDRKVTHRLISYLYLNEPPINIFEVNMRTPHKSDFSKKINFLDFAKDMVPSGSINGIVCLSNAKEMLGSFVVLWNPAINHWKPIRLPKPRSIYDRWNDMSVGLGFDVAANDFKIIRIVPVDVPPYTDELHSSRVEIYSSNKDSWKDVNNKGAFIPFFPKLPNCTFIINNVPYWVGVDNLLEVLGAFDLSTGVYKMVPYPEHAKNGKTWLHPVELRGYIAALVYSPGEIPNQMVDMYVLDEKAATWVKIYKTGPLPFEGLRFPLCFSTGEIVVETWKGNNFEDMNRKPYFYDPKAKRLFPTNGIDDLLVLWYDSYLHVESLVCVKGMELIGKEENKKTKPKKKNWTELLSKDFQLVLS